MNLYGYEVRELVDGSGELSYGPDGRARQRLLVDWADSTPLARRLSGYISENAAFNFIITPPHVHPEAGLVVVDVLRRPFGKPTGYNQWQKAVLEVTYSAPRWENNEGDLTEESVEINGKTISVPGQYVIDADGDEMPDPQQLPVPMGSYVLTLHKMPVFPATVLAAYIGRVNATTFKGAPPGHMLFSSVSAGRKRTTWGDYDWTITLKFDWDPVNDHRQRLNKKKGVYKSIKYKETNADVINAAEFNTMLEFR